MFVEELSQRTNVQLKVRLLNSLIDLKYTCHVLPNMHYILNQDRWRVLQRQKARSEQCRASCEEPEMEV